MPQAEREVGIIWFGLKMVSCSLVSTVDEVRHWKKRLASVPKMLPRCGDKVHRDARSITDISANLVDIG